MKHLTLEEFSAALASADPTPGGGSASAAAGAFAAALLAMLSRLSMGRGGDDILFTRTAEAMGAARVSLLDLAAQDAAAFEAVIAAMRRPRGSDEEKRVRAEAVQRAMRRAAEVPLEVAAQALRVLEAAPDVLRTGNQNAATDGGVAVLLAYACAHGALANVRVNLTSITDETFTAPAAAQAEEIARRASALRDEGMAIMRKRVEG